MGRASRRKRMRVPGQKVESHPVQFGELQTRLQDIYAAVEENSAVPLQAPQLVTTPVIIDGRQVGIKQNWDIELSDGKFRISAYSAIDAIAVFYASMKSYAKANGISEDEVDQVTEYEPLKLIRNLHNVRKHPEMRNGASEKNLGLRDLQRGMKLGPRPMEIDMTPSPRNRGVIDTGGALLTIEASIVNVDSGEIVASLGQTISQSLSRWEEFLRRHGLM